VINPRISSLNKSATLKITALTKKLIRDGEDVVNFAAGEPDFDTPEFIKEEAQKAILEGFTKYTPSTGIPQLKKAIAAKLQEENKLEVCENNIIVTSGAKYAVFVAIFTLADIGDEIIVPSPYWVSYPEMIKLTGTKAVFLPTDESNKFKINPKSLEKAITPKTKVLILNYPSNPTGAVYSANELKEICDLVRKNNIFVISDEIYEALIYDGGQHISFASLPGAEKCTVTINGFSKTFSMTGWRVGYLAAPEEIITAASKIIDHTTSCASSVSQRAALAALRDKDWKKEIRVKFEQRRNLLWEGLSSCDKLKPIKPEGAFYMFCDIRPTGLTSSEFSTKLLQEHLVSCIPADSFGKEGFVRFSFSTSLEQITKGIDRIRDFLGNIQQQG